MVHCRQWCILAHDVRKLSLSLRRKRKLDDRPKTTWGSEPRIVRFTKEAMVYNQELGTHVCVMLVVDSLSEHPVDDCAMSWSIPTPGNQEENQS